LHQNRRTQNIEFATTIMGTSKKSRKVASAKAKPSLKKSPKAIVKKKKVLNSSIIRPSQVDDIPWIYAERKKGEYPEQTENSGKWLIYVWEHNVDLVWDKIKSATEKGLLGEASKVSTAMPSPLAPKPNLKGICVYTYDLTDREDVMRIREELRKIGVTNKIPYKSDNATRTGQYSFTKKGRVSIYYE